MSIVSKNTRTQVVIVLFLMVLMFASIISTKLIVDLSSKKGESGDGYQNVTMTDAYLTCVDRVSDEYGDELYSYAMDDLSTRFDQQHKRFHVFMNVEVVSGPKNAAESSFVACEVSSSGAIANFDVSVETDADGGSTRRSRGNPFGFEF